MIVCAQLSAQNLDWRYQFTAVCDTLNAWRPEIKQIRSELRNSRDTNSEKYLIDAAGRISIRIEQLNRVIDTCNAIKFERSEAGSNCAAYLTVLVESIKLNLKSCISELEICRDYLQKRETAEQLKLIIVELLKQVLKSYLPQ